MPSDARQLLVPFVLGCAARLAASAPVRMPRAGPPTRPVGWSNPQGATLTQIRPDVWLAERPFYPRLPGLTSTDVGGKMAVVRLDDGTLWVHSPVALDDELRDALAALGKVKHVVTPNTEHQKWARDWIEAYPGATSYACPGLRERKPHVGWTRTVGLPGDQHPLEACWVSAERVPLIGSEPFFSEVVFFHAPSRVLFVTDLFWNYPAGADVPASTRAWKWAMDRVYRPFYNRAMRVQPAFDERVWPTLARWDFDMIAPCHGEPVNVGAKRLLAEHLGYRKA
ncbi:hypothetical protein KFE25_013686 [Diacronema lutheri]|uniref:DUF4336 domain-containing protein n=1 Tax=Diacronema lutheri TaxID=2081491 RepID=A0A8J5XJ41_DIALT|nr:hypothetical protein KFE25_013686 [Diacronema lutheri]